MAKHYPEENYGLWGRALTNPTPESAEKRRPKTRSWPGTQDDTDLHDPRCESPRP